MAIARPAGMIPPPPQWGTVAYLEWLWKYQGVIPSWGKRDGKTGKFTVASKPQSPVNGGSHGVPDIVTDAWTALYNGTATQQDLDIYTAWNSPQLWDKYMSHHQDTVFTGKYDGRGNVVANHPVYSDGWTDPRQANGGSGSGGSTDPNKPKDKTPEQIAQERDAITILTDVFSGYDLASLVPKIQEYIQSGVSADAVTILLSQTPEYKQRFAGNDARIKAGLGALSPADYIAAEKSYHQIMAAAGLPTGFYDQHSDFISFIGADVSPAELQDRVLAATDAINKAPASTLDYFKQWYSTGDLIAYALDPTKAAPAIEKNLKAAEAAGLAKYQGFDLGQSDAEHIGSKGLSLDQMQTGMSFVGGELPNVTKLDQIHGGNVTQQDLLGEIFDDNAAAGKKRQQLASQERAAFSGTAGAANSASLASEHQV